MSVTSTNQNIYSSDDLKNLRAEHQNLEDRLLELNRLQALSPEEKYEARFIKKRKLIVKDHLHSLKTRN